MPSLKNLGEFSSSFSKIGRENEARLGQDLPPDHLQLPETEPDPASAPADALQGTADNTDEQNNISYGSNRAAAGMPLDYVPSFEELDNIPLIDPLNEDLNEDLTETEDAETVEDFLNFGDLGDLLGGSTQDITEPDDTIFQDSPDSGDISDLLDTIPDDFSDDMPAEDQAAAGTGAYADTGAEDDAAAFEDNAFSDDAFSMDDLGTDDAFSDDAFSMDDLGDLGDFSDDMPAEDQAAGTGAEDDAAAFEDNAFSDDAFSMDDLGTDDTFSDDAFSMDDLGDFTGDQAEEDQAASADSDTGAAAEDDFGLSGLNLGSEDELSSEDPTADDMDGFDMGGELIDEGSLIEEAEDSFDHFDLDGGMSEGLKDPEPAAGKSDDFGFPDIDDIFSPAAKRTGAAGQDEPDEINLTEKELIQLNETLESYPLNLRIACKEIIVEEAVAPDLMVNLIKALTSGAPPKEAAVIAGKILQRNIPIPKGFEKRTGQQFEEELTSFQYVFIHNFLPVLRTCILAALALVSLGYLVWNFVYKPIRAESVYRRGYERIAAGEYARARELFREAFEINQKKEWFYRYARRYRDERQFIYAQEKYDELLNYTASRNRRGIPDKRAVLEYAAMETYYLRNYAKADRLLRRHILDYSVWDRDALLALGDNNLAWGDIESERYEDAREAYAKLIERYGRSDPILERMLKYFIRTDNLGETLTLQRYFMESEKRRITAETLAELGGYLMDKLTEEILGVRNEYIGSIRGVREVLLRAVRSDPMLPESYFHLARYYNHFSSFRDEELVLARAIQAFDMARMETPRRLGYRLETLRRFGEIHVHRGEFFRGEEYLINAARLYEDGIERRLIRAAPGFGRIYADLGDLEFFVKDGNAAAALQYYRRAEQNGYMPTEIQYRMGAAHYQLSQWSQALERFTAASFPQDFNQRILYALGNTSYLRGNYHAAQGYFDRLLGILEADMTRFTLIRASDNMEENILTERLMVVQNNLAVTLEALANRTGNNEYRSRALSLYTESQRAWDILTRNPETLVRMRPSPDINAPGINPAFLNVQNSLYPVPDYEPLFFMRIDKDLLEPSIWDEIAPPNFRLAEGIYEGR